MKQLVLLVLFAASVMTLSAQKNYSDNNERYHYKHEGNDRKALYNKHENQRDRRAYEQRVSEINRAFDARINSVKHEPFLKRRQKMRKIESLESDRRVALNQCRERFSDRKHKDYARENRRNNNDKW